MLGNKCDKHDTKYKITESVKNLREEPLIRQFLVALGPIVISVVLGMTEGYSTVLLPQLQMQHSTIKIDTELSSWIASISALPMAGGCIVGGYLMERAGRKAIHIWSCIPLILGWIIIAAATNSNLILTGRFLTGLSDGLLGPPISVYIAETSQPNCRGVLIMATCLANNLGIFLVHLLGTFLSWQTTALISGLLPLPFVIFMFFVPESPCFLAKINQIDEAREAFFWCRGRSEACQKELKEIIERQEELSNSPKTSLLQQIASLSRPEFWKPTVLISIFFFTSQITGYNAVASYTIQILQECGIGAKFFDEYFAMITLDIVRLIASVASCILVGKMSRRGLAMLGGFSVSTALFLLSIYLYAAPKIGVSSPILLLLLLSCYVFLISVGLIPLTWTMMGEIFPLDYKGLGTAITSSSCYVFLYVVVLTFPSLLNLFDGIFGVFVFYGTCTFFGTIFLALFLPETKDKPLYIIEDFFRAKKSNENCEENKDTKF